ncbi:uncharacterized protein LOC132745443 isoform X4 [Ruditapes philippinarum]|nr:uncharacterized protein LOC132745443 isoform X4 [Ruditapes philippinarum]XP_060590349.1 uncharacterized protein LOC132745443 isoform X4 [Ruditapes philippinarum]
MFDVFSQNDKSESSEISVLSSQLYILLFHAMVEDLYNIGHMILGYCLTVLNLVLAILLELLSHLSNYIIFVIVLFILVLTAYYLLIQSSKTKYERSNSSVVSTLSDGSFGANSSCDSELDSSVKYYRGNRKYLKLLRRLLFVAVLLTIPWEFIRLYQSAVAEKVALMTAGTPVECIPHQMTPWHSLKSWWRTQFSWMASDPCYQYHKALLVDPLWEVTPLKVISSAFSHCVVYPFEVLLGGFGRALRLFFAEIPAHWQPFMFIALVIFGILSLVMVFGYRIHLPLLFKFEPKTPVKVIKERKSSRVKNEPKSIQLPERSKEKKNMLFFRKSQTKIAK